MKKFLISLSLAAFAFVGCGDDSSASAGANDEPGVESSSSVEQGASSSEKAKPSSSNTQSEAKQSSSSEKTGKSSSSENESSSSSGKMESSSSVETPKSSSSVTVSSSSVTPQSSSSSTSVSSSSISEESSSGSEDKINCSALLEGKTGWSWDVPKECHFNPNIDYGTMTDERDGKVYRTVKISGDIWMAENLNYYDASDLSVKEKSWCFGKKDNGDSTTCDVAGRLYTWAAAIDSVKLANDADNPRDCGYGKTCGLADTVQGVCPSGWHLPSWEEWNELFHVVGGGSTVGRSLKSQTGWYDGSDAYGFSALPAGAIFSNNGFDHDGLNAYFWGSTEEYDDHAYYMYLYNDNTYAFLNLNTKWHGFSVRCKKD